MYNTFPIKSSKKNRAQERFSSAIPPKTHNLFQSVTLGQEEALPKALQMLVNLEKLPKKKKRAAENIFTFFIKRDGIVLPSYSTLAKGCSEKTVQRTMELMESWHIFDRVQRYNNSYVYNFNAIFYDRAVQKLFARSFRAFRFLTKEEIALMPLYSELSDQPRDQKVHLTNMSYISDYFNNIVVDCTDLNNSLVGESMREGTKLGKISDQSPTTFDKMVKKNTINQHSFYLISNKQRIFMSISPDMISEVFKNVTGNELSKEKAHEITSQWSDADISEVFLRLNNTIKDARRTGEHKSIHGGYLFAIYKQLQQQKQNIQTQIIQNTAEDKEAIAKQYEEFAASLGSPRLFEDSKPVYSPHGSSINTTRFAASPFKRKMPIADDDAQLDADIFEKCGCNPLESLPYKFGNNRIKNFEPKDADERSWTYEAFFYVELRKTPEGKRYENEIMPFFMSPYIKKLVPFLESNPNYIPQHKRNAWMQKVLAAAAKLPAAIEIIQKERSDTRVRQYAIDPKSFNDRSTTLGSFMQPIIEQWQKGNLSNDT